MKRRNNELIILFMCCLFLAFISIADIVYHILHSSIGMGDYLWIWRECSIAIKGYNVVEVIRKGITIPGMGEIDILRSATAPWARMMGNIVHPGFLPENVAMVYGVFFYLFVIGLTWKKLFSYLCKHISITSVVS